ncbi:LON peptidase substrate-binding domain-containing protein [Phaeovibrio sulfidiphilus]|uniref:LON peptidase substrate-binding domain-containing protein n=1 Tax=Phaeovibrio sulfidiphilus TaxID=1220600 RepID=A0A8J7CPP4_9PROT|nr:LON peptidase substrate-binding domain-containing protein [Phaeovibrio sulfidiphilus]MBE1237262.1 LON peptidase substrate-binding domain-containing protein [Phaeovibrio sulfidiphilus]
MPGTRKQTVFTLPDAVPVYPLSGVLLLPSATLPLDIVEPHHCAMVEDALAEGRHMALVQPVSSRPGEAGLYRVGCLGRIISFLETGEGRYEIGLLGLRRVHLLDEQACDRGYRRFSLRAEDLPAGEPQDSAFLFDDLDDLDTFFDTLSAYAETYSIGFDHEVLRSIPAQNLVNALCMACPFDPREKQALLEAENLRARAVLLHNLLQISLRSPLSSDSTQ